MQNRISNELVAFSILALLVLGNLFYLFLPAMGNEGFFSLAPEDRQEVAAIPQNADESGAAIEPNLLSKESLRSISPTQISGSGKGSMVLRSDFAVLFQAQDSLQAVEVHWQSVRRNYPEAMAEMMPLARIEETAEDGRKGMTLHLAVGPFSNVQDAAYLCVSLQRKGETCRVAPFSGQPLDLFGQAALEQMSRERRTPQTAPQQ